MTVTRHERRATNFQLRSKFTVFGKWSVERHMKTYEIVRKSSTNDQTPSSRLYPPYGVIATTPWWFRTSLAPIKIRLQKSMNVRERVKVDLVRTHRFRTLSSSNPIWVAFEQFHRVVSMKLFSISLLSPIDTRTLPRILCRSIFFFLFSLFWFIQWFISGSIFLHVDAK